MNDRHASGSTTPTVPAADAPYGFPDTYGQQDVSAGYGGYHDSFTGLHESGLHGAFGAGYEDDPLFGALPGSHGAAPVQDPGGHDAAAPHAPSHAAGQWTSQSPVTAAHDPYGSPQATAYGTGSHDTSVLWEGYEGYATGVPLAEAPGQTGHTYGAGVRLDGAVGADGSWDPAATAVWESGSAALLDATALIAPVPGAEPAGLGAALYDTAGFDTAVFDAEGLGAGGFGAAAATEATAVWETGAYAAEAAAQGYGAPGDGYAQAEPYGIPGHDLRDPYDPQGYEAAAETGADPDAMDPDAMDPDAVDPDGGYEGSGYEGGGYGDDVEPEGAYEDGPAGSAAPAPVRRAGGTRRRRGPAKRSALLTVAAPSVAVMGVAGIAAASVGADETQAARTTAASDDTAVQPSAANRKLDTQLATLTADAGDFADRASRTQERLDLKQRQAEERKRKAEEAARREALRPKFALPVEQRGLSAQYGQAGVNWMSLHSGIDFPVGYGTPVMAATDGTVRTQWNPAYGNMAIVTAPDGTETWYCHLSSTKIRSGSVKAGDTIAYSGNSGNSTGPHLHFEVHPGGGSAIDPVAWFQEHGLNPQ